MNTILKKGLALIILMSFTNCVDANNITPEQKEKKEEKKEQKEEKKDEKAEGKKDIDKEEKEPEKETKENEFTGDIYSEAKSYLVKSLNEKNLQLFQLKKTIKAGEIKEAQNRIWKEWKEANDQKQEEKLGHLEPLSQYNKSSWTLLEEWDIPAIMPFHYGSKDDITEGKYPLFIYTHGSGPKAREWQMGFIMCRGFDDAPSAYFIPQIPNEGPYYRWWQKAKQFAWEKLLRLGFVGGEIDPNRVYIIGVSEGGYGSQRLASFYADYLAGAGPMAGGEPLENTPVENCRNIAFSLRTGSEDYMYCRNLLTAYAKETFERLQKENPGAFNHNIQLIPGEGHIISYSETTPWLKNFSRVAQPKQVMWEDFELDGQRRKGFYNIQIIERPQKDGRTFYNMDIKENVVNITVDNVEYQPTEKDKRWGIWLRFNKKYTPLKSGKIKLYLSEKLVNLDEEVTVNINGNRVFQGKVEPNIESMVNSCATFFDPERIFPASLVLEIK